MIILFLNTQYFIQIAFKTDLKVRNPPIHFKLYTVLFNSEKTDD